MARFLARNRYTAGSSPRCWSSGCGQPAHRRAGTVAGKAHSALVFAELLGLLNQQLADSDDAIALAVERHSDAATSPRSLGSGRSGPRSCWLRPGWRQ